MSAEVPYVSRGRLRVPRRVVVLSVLALLGVGGIAAVLVLKSGGASSRFDGFVYVESNRARTDGNSILTYRFRDNRLTFVAEHPTGGTGAIDPGLTGALDADGQIAVDLRRRLLFAVNQGSDTVAVFRLAADGRPVPVTDSPFASGGKAPASVAVAGPFLVVVNKAHDAKRALERTPPRYSVFRIGENGSLTPTGTSFQAPASSSPTQALAVSSRVIVGTEESGPFRAFVVTANGSLFQGANSPLDPEDSLFPARYQGSRWAIGIVRHPAGGLIYANQPAIAKLLVYSYDGTGRLTFVRAVDNDGAKLPCWTAVTPDGRRLYTANAGNGTVSSYTLSRDRESPRRLQLLALEGGGNPWGLALDPAGRTLFVVDARATFDVPRERGNRLHALAVGSDGRLTELDASPVRLPVGANASPLGIAVVPR